MVIHELVDVAAQRHAQDDPLRTWCRQRRLSDTLLRCLHSLYPLWKYYLSSATPPLWVRDFVAAVAAARPLIDTANISGLTSNKVLAALKPGLERLQYEVEDPARKLKVYRPVLFGENGVVQVPYHVGAVHDALGVVVEIEGGRGARGNALYRDLIRASLIVNAKYLVIGLIQTTRTSRTPRSTRLLVTWSRRGPSTLSTLARIMREG